jgi:hypothetical protein
MAYVGKLSVFEDNGSAGNVFDFINVNFPGGWPEDSLQRVGEPITAMGINGTRARYTREDYPQFVMQAIGEESNWAGAVATVASMRLARIKRAKIQVTTNGVTYTFSNRMAYIWAVDPRPRPGTVVTPNGAIVNPQASVMSNWTLQFIPGT